MKFKSTAEFDAVYDALGQYVETCRAVDPLEHDAEDEYQAFPYLQMVEVLLMDMDAQMLAKAVRDVKKSKTSRETIMILMRCHKTLRMATKRRGIEATLTQLSELTSILSTQGVLYLGDDHYHHTKAQRGSDED